MCTNILIPTDGSGVSRKVVQHGVALAKRVDAESTALTVLPPYHTFVTDTQMIDNTRAECKARMQEHAEKATTISFSRLRTISSGSSCAYTTFCPVSDRSLRIEIKAVSPEARDAIDQRRAPRCRERVSNGTN
ncbi:MAG: universal stress protein [Rhodomicrobiaceae bacterium]